MEITPVQFSVVPYGQLTKYNDVLSKARLRIFYKGPNRNRTFITDEFADKLLSTVAYAPIKGIWSEEKNDFLDHGEDNSDGRIYGIVPADPNLKWEDHEDEDGVMRSYACVDVLLFTGLYKEASLILGKAQSMELYRPSIKFHYQMVDNKKYITFDEGCFVGLQALGDDVEPCFEGAAFYALKQQIQEIMTALENGGTNFMNSELENVEITETETAPAPVADSEIESVSEPEEPAAEVIVEEIPFDTSAIEEALGITSTPEFTDAEKSIIYELKALNGDTLESVSEVLLNAKTNFEKVAKITELEEEISTYKTERVQMAEDFAKLKAEVEELREYKCGAETRKREMVLESYEGLLPTEILEEYRKKCGNCALTEIELDMELTYQLRKLNPAAFSESHTAGIVLKDEPATGIEAILATYHKN